MSNYRRLISYMYAYEGQVKGKNIGFAKLEVRNGQCKIQVSVKKVYESGNDVGVYLLTDEMEILIGKIYIRNGSGEFRTSVRADNVEMSGFSMAQIYGLTIHDVKNPWVSYTTIWEDAVTQAAQVDLEHVTSENYKTEESQEEREMRIVQQIEEEVERQEREKERIQKEEEQERQKKEQEQQFWQDEVKRKSGFREAVFQENHFVPKVQDMVFWKENVDRNPAVEKENKADDTSRYTQDNEKSYEITHDTEDAVKDETAQIVNDGMNREIKETNGKTDNRTNDETGSLPNAYISASNNRMGEEEGANASAQKEETIQLYRAEYVARKGEKNKAESNYAVGYGNTRRESIRDENIRSESIRNESVRDENIRPESTRYENVRYENAGRESIRPESIRNEDARYENIENGMFGTKRWECEPQFIRQRMAESPENAKTKSGNAAKWNIAEHNSANKDAKYASWLQLPFSGAKQTNQKNGTEQTGEYSAGADAGAKDSRLSGWPSGIFTRKKAEETRRNEFHTFRGLHEKYGEETETQPAPGIDLARQVTFHLFEEKFEEKPTEKMDALQSGEIWKSKEEMEIKKEVERTGEGESTYFESTGMEAGEEGNRWEGVPYIKGKGAEAGYTLEPVTEKIFSSKMLSQKAAQFMAQNYNPWQGSSGEEDTKEIPIGNAVGEAEAGTEQYRNEPSSAKEWKWPESIIKERKYAEEKTEEDAQQKSEKEASENAEKEVQEKTGEPALPRVGFKQDEEKLKEFEQEEKTKSEDSEKLWESLRSLYPKLQEFDYDNGCEILAIKPKDIGLLPRENWVYGNNSFLLHGYYNYRYLILAQLTEAEGKQRYVLGVPGHYYSNDKYMASMFGFPGFVLSKKQPTEDGRFGYWYTNITMQAEE